MEFFIKDTGIGVRKERQEAIFERFIQADIQDVNARQGAGLGLTISKAYAGMLGGTIRVESEEGEGSTFYFTLPYQSIIDEGNSENEISNPNSTSEIKNKSLDINVLIVEDDDEKKYPVKITNSDGLSVSIEFDKAGKPLRIVYPDGAAEAYQYNNKGQMTEAVKGAVKFKFGYDEYGNVNEIRYPTGAVVRYILIMGPNAL